MKPPAGALEINARVRQQERWQRAFLKEIQPRAARKPSPMQLHARARIARALEALAALIEPTPTAVTES